VHPDRGRPAAGLPAAAGRNTRADELGDQVGQAVGVGQAAVDGLALQVSERRR
jgi:hypothetical protein